MLIKTKEEEWLKDMPERIMCLLLVKQVAKQEALSSEQIEDELGGRPAKEETILNSINYLCRNQLITWVTNRTWTGTKIMYKLTETGLGEIQEFVDTVRIRKLYYH